MEEVQALCERVAIMDHGRVLISGLLSEILRESSGWLTLRLGAPLPASLAADWQRRYALKDEGGARYRLRMPQAGAVSEALDQVRAAGCEPLSIAYGQRDLEQLFMQLTQRSLRD
jgi:ABC-2 type transport system ATP-binding protein